MGQATTCRDDVKGRIISFRKEKGFSRRELGESWGISWRTIEAWELGRRTPHGLYREKVESILKEIESKR